MDRLPDGPFQRYTAPDAAALEAGIEDTRAKLIASCRETDPAAMVEHAADLGSLLTTARQEAQALRILDEHVALAASLPSQEPAGWFWNAYATALQYVGRRDEADEFFAMALMLSQQGGWLRLQATVLHHWGRNLVEQMRWDDAEARFSQALELRLKMDDPRQASTRRALEALGTWRGSAGGDAGRLA